MRKFLALLVLGVFTLGATQAIAQVPASGPTWRSVDLAVRRSGNALTSQTATQVMQGYIDSTFVYNGGLARLDTLVAVNFPGWSNTAGINTPDSLSVMRVEVLGSQAFASGESLYVTFDGLDGNAYVSLGCAQCATCAPGGYAAAKSLVPGTATGASRIFNAAGNADATSCGVTSALWGAYGNYKLYPTIRLRVHSDYAVVPVAQLIRYRLWYQSYLPASDAQ